MIQDHISAIADEIALQPAAVQAAVSLLRQGATIPFIARYRKEATGDLNEVAITAIRDRLSRLEELDARKATVLKSLETHGHLTDELKQKVISAADMASLEDIYLPYRTKRRTKAMIAREKGLEPLALKILEQTEQDPHQLAAEFLDPEKDVVSTDDALDGARHIIAEIINEDPAAREKMRGKQRGRGNNVRDILTFEHEPCHVMVKDAPASLKATQDKQFVVLGRILLR